MSKSAAMDLVMQFMGKQNTIPTPVPFIRLLGDHAAAAFLSQCLYWGERTTDAEGWFHKTHDEWQDELVLSPDQVRRCVKTCGPLVQVKRKGVPARNFYRADRAAVADALERLAAGETDPLRCGQTQHLETDKPNDKGQGNPTTSDGQTPRQVVQETQHLVTEPTSEPTTEQKENPLAAGAAAPSPEIREPQEPQPQTEGSNHTPDRETISGDAKNGNATDSEKVPPAAPRPVEKPVDNRKNAQPSDFARIVAAWNDHRGSLPEVQNVTEGRKKAVRKLLRDCGGDVGKAIQVLTAATHEVAQDEFWQTHRYGFDNLVPGKVIGKAEAWRARQGQSGPAPAGQPSAPLTTNTYRVGQRVSYKREAYTIEHITDTFVDLYDEENGSSRVLLNSSDWAAIRPIGSES